MAKTGGLAGVVGTGNEAVSQPSSRSYFTRVTTPSDLDASFSQKPPFPAADKSQPEPETGAVGENNH